VPARFFTPRTTFTLNNRSYESILGGSPDDPLIRLLSRGAAGYRTAAKALQYALQGAAITIESVSEPDASGLRSASVLVEGQLRHTGEPFAARATLGLAGTDVELTSVDVRCSEEDLARIAASRRA
jgi:ribosomal protein S11